MRTDPTVIDRLTGKAHRHAWATDEAICCGCQEVNPKGTAAERDELRATLAVYEERERQVVELHKPSDDLIEIEVNVDQADCTRDICAECDRYGEHEETRSIRICNQCGEGVSPDACDAVVYFEWPCATAKLLGLDAALAASPDEDETRG